MSAPNPMPDQIIKVAVVDDEKPIRELLRSWLNDHADYQCVGAWTGMREIAESLVWKKPDVILLDVHLDEESGVDLLPQIKALLREARVIMLTGDEDYYWIKQALQRGADGYLLKTDMPDNLGDAIAVVLRGGSPLSGQVGRQLIERNLRTSNGRSPVDKLSPREKLVLHELSEGLVYKEVAVKLEISLETVRTHARRIFRKLGVQNRTEAVLAYLRHS